MKCFYDPETRQIVLTPDATLWARFHELAHKEQHDKMAFVFRAWTVMRYFRILNYFADLWIELDAHFRAKRVMQVLGVWSDEACQEGRNNLMSYAMRKE